MTQMQNQKDEAKGNLNPNLTELKVGKFEKLLLVWGGKYKKMEDVPNLVNQSVLEKARNKARVKISIGMIVATLIGCIIMVISGKRAAERGETISKINADFRRELAEKANKE
ncbi:hypothetical protein Avbf_02114 [Armadillidium vulgare]|nr:hypothetical protein Avbf_02114 [Armadillidium vulgare]